MPFRFRPSDDSVRAAFRRLARNRLEKALGQAGRSAPAIHTLRKRNKELRGLLQLHRPVFRDFDRIDRQLRDMARALAPARDAEVMLATVRLLARDLPPDPGNETVIRALQDRLEQKQRAGEIDAALKICVQGLGALSNSVPDWKLDARGFDALAPGIELTVRESRKRLRQAARQLDGPFDAAPFHAWRKTVKHHWYHARLLEPLWPAMMTPYIKALDDLGEVLGAHNDMDVALEHLHTALRAQEPDAVAALTRVGMRQRRELATRAVADGRRLFADPPGAVSARWAVWWQQWRARGKRS